MVAAVVVVVGFSSRPLPLVVFVLVVVAVVVPPVFVPALLVPVPVLLPLVRTHRALFFFFFFSLSLFSFLSFLLLIKNWKL